MKLAITFLLAGPALGAALAIAVPRRIARAAAAIGAAVGLGGALAALAFAVDRGETGARGLEADPWRAGLAAAAFLVVLAGLLARERRSEEPEITAAAVAGTGAAAVSILAPDAFSFAVAAAATTLAFGAVTYAHGGRSARRALWWVALSDAVLIGGLLMTSRDGMLLPLEAEGLGAWLLAAAALIRGGTPAVARWFGDPPEQGPAVASMALGPLRAQALLIGGWIALGAGPTTRGAAAALAIGAALAAAWSARRAARDASYASAAAAHTGLILAGIALGGDGARGAVLLAAGVFLAPVLAMLGRSGIARATFAAGPLGATLPGAIVVVVAAFSRALDDRWLFAVALPAAAALLWLAQAGVSGVFRPVVSRARPIWAILPALAAGAIVLRPASALQTVDVAALALGTGRALSPTELHLSDDFGLAFAIAALASLLAVRPVWTPRERPNIEEDVTALPEPFAARALVPVAVATVAGLAWLLQTAIRRGFL